MKWHGIDVCAWRAAGVATKILPGVEADAVHATPKQYVEQAFSKCTSGVHHGFLPHEIAGMVLENIKDIVPEEAVISVMTSVFQRIEKKLNKNK